MCLSIVFDWINIFCIQTETRVVVLYINTRKLVEQNMPFTTSTMTHLSLDHHRPAWCRVYFYFQTVLFVFFLSECYITLFLKFGWKYNYILLFFKSTFSLGVCVICYLVILTMSLYFQYKSHGMRCSLHIKAHLTWYRAVCSLYPLYTCQAIT